MMCPAETNIDWPTRKCVENNLQHGAQRSARVMPAKVMPAVASDPATGCQPHEVDLLSDAGHEMCPVEIDGLRWLAPAQT